MIKREGEWMVVQGSLNIETVPALFETGLQHLVGEDLQVDFSQVDIGRFRCSQHVAGLDQGCPAHPA